MTLQGSPLPGPRRPPVTRVPADALAESVRSLDDAWFARDRDVLARAAHGLEASVRDLGLTELAGMLADLERHAAQDDWPALGWRVGQIAGTWDANSVGTPGGPELISLRPAEPIGRV